MATSSKNNSPNLNNQNTVSETELFLDNIFENIPDMVFIKEAKELRFVKFNKAAEELLGYKREDLIGKNDYDFFPPSEVEHFIKKDREVLEKGIVLDIPEEPIHTKYKGLRWLHTKKIPIRDKNGVPVFLLGISRDITELKQTRERLVQLVDELEKKVAERTSYLQTANEELRRLSQVTSEFAIMVTHELRTPLCSMKEGIHQLMDGLDGPLNEAQQETLEIVQKNTDRLSRMISNVLEFQKMESGLHLPKMAQTDLSLILAEVTSAMEKVARQKNIQIRRDFASEPIWLVCDSDKIHQLLVNLFDNAIKFTPAGGQITLSCHKNSAEIELEISDTGMGIRQEDSETIFRLFGQGLHKGSWKTGGFGVGLAVCKKIVEMHQGQIYVQSEVDKGTTFRIRLPLTLAEGRESK